MNKPKRSKTPPCPRSDANKIALATGSLSALSLLSFGAEAGIIYYNTPITVTPSTNTTWSVDNSGRATFNLVGSAFPIAKLNSNGAFARGMVQKTSQFNSAFQNLPLNVVVGPTLAAGYQFGPDNQGNRFVAFYGSVAGTAVGFSSGVNGYFGFQFTDAGLSNRFYGWAQINIDGLNASYTINNWAYNNVAGQSIAVGDTGQTTNVPEPDTLSLTLLGLGAAGIRSWRQRKQAAAG